MATLLKEVVIGTDDVNTVINNTVINTNEINELEEHLPEPPSLVVVEEFISSLRHLLENEGAPIGPNCIKLIYDIVDRLDQVYYWAIEEGTTFLHQPSVLAQCEVPQFTILCLLTGRPKIILATLRIMKHLFRHNQSGPHLFNAAAKEMKKEKEEENLLVGVSTNNDNNFIGSSFYIMLADLMGKHVGIAELQAEAAAVASEASKLDIEGILNSDIISHVLTALQRHGENTCMQREGIKLFATLVSIPRETKEEDDKSLNKHHNNILSSSDDDDNNNNNNNNNCRMPLIQTAVLFCHIGVVLRFVLDAARANADNIEVKRNAVKFFRHCVDYTENLQFLIINGVYSFLVSALTSAIRVPELFLTLIESIVPFISLLDIFQRRSLVLVLRQILVSTASPFFISICVAVLIRLLPPTSSFSKIPIVEIEENNILSSSSLKERKLEYSCTIALNNDDTRMFMIENSIPQLLCYAADVLGEEDALLRRTVSEAIALLSQFHWR